MYDYSKLKGRITEKFGTQAKFSKALHLSENAVSNKLRNVYGFSQKDIERWSEPDLLDIEPKDYPVYFFVHKLNDV